MALQWSGGIAVMLLVKGFWKKPWHIAVASGLFAIPLIGTFWVIIDSLSVLADRGSVLRPYTRDQLSFITSRKLLEDLGYLLLGAYIWIGEGSWRRMASTGPSAIAAWLRRIGVPLGASEGKSIAHGTLLFPVLFIVTIGADFLTRGFDAIRNGDESSVWDNMTIFHAIMLACAAGFGEEFVYRGVLQTWLRKFTPLWTAIALQGIFFGFAHSGYGTWAHLIAATSFGLFAGFVAWRYGIWAAIMIHVLIDIYAWGPVAASNTPWFGALLGMFLVLSTIASIWAGARWAITRGRGPEAPG